MIQIIFFLIIIKLLLKPRSHFYHAITIDIEDRIDKLCNKWHTLSEEKRIIEIRKLTRHVDAYMGKLPYYHKNMKWNDVCCRYVLEYIKRLLQDKQLVYQADLSDFYQDVINSINQHYPPYAEKVVSKYVYFSMEESKEISTTAE